MATTASFQYDPNLPKNIPPGEIYQSNPKDLINLPYEQNSREGNAAQQAVIKFREIMGRDPTSSELSQVVPIFMGGDPNVSDIAGGTAWISALANSPDEVYKRQQTQYGKDAPKQYDTVKQQFQSILGRDPSQEEMDHFGKVLASGQVDQYQLQDFLKQQPEYTSKKDAAMRQSLSGELQQGDARYFNEQIMPGIQSNFAKQGRSVESSGFANALGQQATAQNRDREQFLANLTAQQYGGQQANARADYEAYYNNLMNRQNTSLTAPYARQMQLEDFNIQNQMYQQYLAKYGKRGGNSVMGGLQGAIGGATMGAKFGPWGALAGGVAGGGLGAWGSSQGGNY